MIKNIILASTSAQSEKLNNLKLDDLQTMSNQLNQYILPLGVEQDPRIPPRGRIIGGDIEKTENGNYNLIGQVEFFESDLKQLKEITDKELKIKLFIHPTIIYDTHYLNSSARKKIYDLKVLLGGQEELESKKINETLSVLILGFNNAMGSISKSFYGRYNRSELKDITHLLSLLLIRSSVDEEKLFSFQNTLKHGNIFINIEIILTNPEPKEIIKFFMKSLKKFDSLLVKHYQVGKGIRKMVYQYHKSEFELIFVLLKNGIPLFPRRK